MNITVNNALQIKKYKNRKLYNTVTGKYITNTDIITYLKNNVKFQVVTLDGGDITNKAIRSVLSTISRNIPQEKLEQLVVTYG